MRLRSAIALLTISLVWGLYYLAVDLLLASGWNNEWMNALRFLLGGSVLILFLLLRGRSKELYALQKSHAKEILIVSWVGVLLGMYFLTEGQERVTSSVAGTLSSMIIIFVALLATTRFFGARILSSKEWLGLLLGFLGAALIYNPWQEVGLDFLGFILVIAGAFFIAFESLFLAKWFQKENPLAVVSLVVFWAGIGFLLLALGLGRDFQSGNWWLLLILALGSNIFIYMLYFWLVMEEGPVFANISSYLIPAVALLAGLLLNNEPFTYLLLLGAAACLLGAFLVSEEESAARTDSDKEAK